jgi:hypothetical protein
MNITNKSEFMAYLHQSWTELQQTLNALSDEQMTTLKDHVGWTIKDHLSHLIAWERGIVALLQYQPRYPAMGIDLATLEGKNEDEENEILRKQFETHSLAEVRAALQQTHEALVAVLNSLSDEDLLKPYAHYQPNEPGKDEGRPIYGWVMGNSAGHYAEHLPWIKALAHLS